MKKLLLLLICTGTSVLVTNAQSKQNNLENRIAFRDNKGQVCDQDNKLRPDVLFSGNAGQLAFHLKSNGISYQLQRTDSWKTHRDSKTNEDIALPDQKTIYRLDINWLNAKSNTVIQKKEKLEGYENFYLAHCPDGVLNVYSYEEIVYKELYKGIDLKWYGKDGNLKYDYIVSPGADYKFIQLQVEGADKISLDNKGNLILQTPLGTIVEHAPVVIQNERMLPSKWILKNNLISFDIKNIDPSKSFIIDPSISVRKWGTYYGGAGFDVTNASSIDPQGNVYLAGYTTSSVSTIIATSGSHQNTYGGYGDAFLAKFNVSGIRKWCTYYGGATDDMGQATCTDNFGRVYLVGWTNSSNAIATLAAFKTTNDGADGFMVQFDSIGVRQWGTYYGSTNFDEGRGCTTDASGNVYLIGHVDGGVSTDIATPSSHQPTSGGGANDGFLAKFDINGNRIWATYYGGNGADYAYACATDATGNIFLVGQTNSTNGTSIATTASYQTTLTGTYDSYLAKFDGNGSRLWSTYYGGSGAESGLSCNVGATGSIVISGYTSTNSGTVMYTSGAHQTNYGGGAHDGFIAVFDQTGNRQYGSFYGGGGADYAWSSMFDTNNNLFVGGYTNSSANISMLGCPQYTLGGNYDAFLAKFDNTNTRVWSTYCGGAGDDRGYGCVVDNNGNSFLSGRTASASISNVATSPAHQTAHGGGSTDGFLVKYTDCASGFFPMASTYPATLCAGSTATMTATGATTYSWSTGSVSPTITVAPSVPQNVTVTMGDGTNCSVQMIVTQWVISCVGIEENTNDDRVSIYPNPTSGIINLQFQKQSPSFIEVRNSLGQLITSIEAKEKYASLDLSNYPAGLYFVTARSENSFNTSKFIKQ